MKDQLGEETEQRIQADTQIQQDIDDINLMPIGSIIAWIIKPTKESANATYLPEGWIRCDGTTIPPPSIWAGSKTPDLNNNKHFLRGGSDSDYLESEDDQIQDLEISLIDPGHTHSEKGHQHTSTTDKFYDPGFVCNMDSKKSGNEWHECSTHDFSQDWWTEYHRPISFEHIEIYSAETKISFEMADYRRGDETRPVNTKVIWIMRVW